jgi:hypothetical protein
MPTFLDSPLFEEGAFLFALLLILGAWKFGIEGLME